MHSAFGLPQPEHTSSSTGFSAGVHPQDSHICISFSLSGKKMIWKILIY